MTSRHIIFATELLVDGVVRWCVGVDEDFPLEKSDR